MMRDSSNLTMTIAPAGGTSHPGEQSTTSIGDWLVAFGDLDAPLPRRAPDARWQPEGGSADWRWMLTHPSEDWRGAPLLPVQTGGWTAWLIGELFDTSDPAQLVIDLLQNRIPAGRLNGHFLLVAAHHQAGELHVWTNRHATLHAYLATNGSRTAVGSFMPSVAAATGRQDLDWEGLTSFFTFGFFAGDRTHYQGVRILRPATHYRLGANGRLIAQEQYWQWQHAPDASRSYDETLEEFAGLFASVMNDMTAEGRIALPISGGLDSRSTIATIAAGHPGRERLWTYSYGYSEHSIETAIAGRIAKARSLPHTPFTIGPYFFERLSDVIGAIEGFQDVLMARQAAITGSIRRNADSVIAAHWGDVFLDDMGLASLSDGSLSRDELVGRAAAKFRKPVGWIVEALCRPRLGASTPDDMLHALLGEEIAKYDEISEPDFFIKALKTDQWSARWTTASLRMFQAGAFPRLPFYDTRISDFFMTVPTAYVAGRRLQIDYLKRYAPDLAAVDWQETGSSLFKLGQRDPLALARRAVHKSLRLLRGRRVIERNWEVQLLNPDGRRELENWLLRPGLLLHDFISPQRLAGELEAFFASPWEDKRSYPISMLLTFSAWLELQSGVSRAAAQ